MSVKRHIKYIGLENVLQHSRNKKQLEINSGSLFNLRFENYSVQCRFREIGDV